LILAALVLLASGCTDSVDLPEPYASLPVPASIESMAARARGRELYVEHCVLCHGENADGRGQRRASHDPKPRDYTDPSWRASASPRTVYYAISQGVQGTSMPAWSVLEEEEIWDLVAYVLSVAEHGAQPATITDTSQTRDNGGALR
jgi:high-affinity iron transporter